VLFSPYFLFLSLKKHGLKHGLLLLLLLVLLRGDSRCMLESPNSNKERGTIILYFKILGVKNNDFNVSF